MGEEGMMGGGHTQALVRQEFLGVERLVGAFLLHHTHLHLHDNHLKPGTFVPPCQITAMKNRNMVRSHYIDVCECEVKQDECTSEVRKTKTTDGWYWRSRFGACMEVGDGSDTLFSFEPLESPIPTYRGARDPEDGWRFETASPLLSAGRGTEGIER